MILNAQARSQLRKVKQTLDELKAQAASAEAAAKKSNAVSSCFPAALVDFTPFRVPPQSSKRNTKVPLQRMPKGIFPSLLIKPMVQFLQAIHKRRHIIRR